MVQTQRYVNLVTLTFNRLTSEVVLQFYVIWTDGLQSMVGLLQGQSRRYDAIPYEYDIQCSDSAEKLMNNRYDHRPTEPQQLKYIAEKWK